MCVCVCGALVIAESIASSCQLTSYAGVRTGDNGLHLMNFPAGGFCAPPKTGRKQESTRYWWNKQNSIAIRNIVCSDMVYITGRCFQYGKSLYISIEGGTNAMVYGLCKPTFVPLCLKILVYFGQTPSIYSKQLIFGPAQKKNTMSTK